MSKAQLFKEKLAEKARALESEPRYISVPHSSSNLKSSRASAVSNRRNHISDLRESTAKRPKSAEMGLDNGGGLHDRSQSRNICVNLYEIAMKPGAKKKKPTTSNKGCTNKDSTKMKTFGKADIK